ncbi:hypothetical protein SAMN06265361_102254 [Laceyella tengchongensis]|uniref:Uncharacterized protein n=1 Tax=Laceyella tengchongensis TaxID=574699 RepID=A0AA45WLH5_9BACL|nr:hypothetical protein [Laceyella tengchongensis]SMP11321.1 hypothetical protein SAMN06265361_102254 [Laceyella tengchongensis]
MAKCASRLASKPSLLHLLSNALAAVRADLNAVRMFPNFFGDQLLRLKRLITQDADHFHDDSVLSVQMVTARMCLANQVGGEEAAEKPFLEERLVTREANEKMVLEPLAYTSDTP